MANTSKIIGVAELNKKLSLLQSNFGGPPIRKLCQAALQPIASQAKSNARRGPTGNLIRGIKIFAGNRAVVRFGATAVLKVAWKYSGAIFEEWGRREITPADTRKPGTKAFRVPLGKFTGGLVGGVTKKGRYRKGSFTTFASGFAFWKRIRAMSGTHFFENAVDQRMPESQKLFEAGCKKIIDDSVR